MSALPFDTTGLSQSDIEEIYRKHNRLAIEIEESVENTENSINKSKIGVGSARSLVAEGKGARSLRVRMVMRQSYVWAKGLANERRIDEYVGDGTNKLTDLETSFRQEKSDMIKAHRDELKKAKQIANEWRNMENQRNKK